MFCNFFYSHRWSWVFTRTSQQSCIRKSWIILFTNVGKYSSQMLDIIHRWNKFDKCVILTNHRTRAAVCPCRNSGWLPALTAASVSGPLIGPEITASSPIGWRSRHLHLLLTAHSSSVMIRWAAHKSCHSSLKIKFLHSTDVYLHSTVFIRSVKSSSLLRQVSLISRQIIHGGTTRTFETGYPECFCAHAQG